MKLKDLEQIEDKLMKIRNLVNPEDGYVICDTIVTSINDQELESHVQDMMIAMGYEKELIIKVTKIVREIQK